MRKLKFILYLIFLLLAVHCADNKSTQNQFNKTTVTEPVELVATQSILKFPIDSTVDPYPRQLQLFENDEHEQFIYFANGINGNIFFHSTKTNELEKKIHIQFEGRDAVGYETTRNTTFVHGI